MASSDLSGSDSALSRSSTVPPKTVVDDVVDGLSADSDLGDDGIDQFDDVDDDAAVDKNIVTIWQPFDKQTIESEDDQKSEKKIVQKAKPLKEDCLQVGFEKQIPFAVMQQMQRKNDIAFLPYDLVSSVFLEEVPGANEKLLFSLKNTNERFVGGIVYKQLPGTHNGHFTSLMFDKRDKVCLHFESLSNRDWSAKMMRLAKVLRVLDGGWSVKAGDCLMQPGSFECGDFSFLNILVSYEQRQSDCTWSKALRKAETALKCGRLQTNSQTDITSPNTTVCIKSRDAIRSAIRSHFDECGHQVDQQKICGMVELRMTDAEQRLWNSKLKAVVLDSSDDGDSILGSDDDSKNRPDDGDEYAQLLQQLKDAKKMAADAEKRADDEKKKRKASDQKLNNLLKRQKTGDDGADSDFDEPPMGFAKGRRVSPSLKQQKTKWDGMQESQKVEVRKAYKMFTTAERLSKETDYKQLTVPSTQQFWKALMSKDADQFFGWVNQQRIEDLDPLSPSKWRNGVFARCWLFGCTAKAISNFATYSDAQRATVFECKIGSAQRMTYEDRQRRKLLSLKSDTLQWFLDNFETSDQLKELAGADTRTFHQDMLTKMNPQAPTGNDDEPYSGIFTFVDTKKQADLSNDKARAAHVKGILNKGLDDLARERAWVELSTEECDKDGRAYIQNIVLPELSGRHAMVLNKSMVFNCVKLHWQFWYMYTHNTNKTQIFLANGAVQVGKSGLKEHIDLSMRLFCRTYPDAGRKARSIIFTDKVGSAVQLAETFRQGAGTLANAKVDAFQSQRARAKDAVDQAEADLALQSEDETIRDGLIAATKYFDELMNMGDVNKLILQHDTYLTPDKVFGMTPVIDKGHTQRDNKGKLVNMQARRKEADSCNHALVVCAATSSIQLKETFKLCDDCDLSVVMLDEGDIVTGSRVPKDEFRHQQHEVSNNSTLLDKQLRLVAHQHDVKALDSEDDDLTDDDLTDDEDHEFVADQSLEDGDYSVNTDSTEGESSNSESTEVQECMEAIKRTESPNLIMTYVSATATATVLDLFRLTDSNDRRQSDRVRSVNYCLLKAQDVQYDVEIDGVTRKVEFQSNHVSLKNYKVWQEHDSDVFLPEDCTRQNVVVNAHVRAMFKDSLRKDMKGATQRSLMLIVGNPGVNSKNGTMSWQEELHKYADAESKKPSAGLANGTVVPIIIVMAGAASYISFPGSPRQYSLRVSRTHEGPPQLVQRGKTKVFVYRGQQSRAMASEFLAALHELSPEFCRQHGVNNEYPITILGDSQCKRCARFNGSWGGVTHYINAQTVKTRSLDDIMQQFRGHGLCAGAFRKYGWVDESGEPVIRTLIKRSLWEQLQSYETLPETICKGLEDLGSPRTLTECVDGFLKNSGSSVPECDKLLAMFGTETHPVFNKRHNMQKPVSGLMGNRLGIKKRKLEAAQAQAAQTQPAQAQTAQAQTAQAQTAANIVDATDNRESGNDVNVLQPGFSEIHDIGNLKFGQEAALRIMLTLQAIGATNAVEPKQVTAHAGTATPANVGSQLRLLTLEHRAAGWLRQHGWRMHHRETKYWLEKCSTPNV